MSERHNEHLYNEFHDGELKERIIPKEEFEELRQMYFLSSRIAEQDKQARSEIISGGALNWNEIVRDIELEIKDSEEVKQKHADSIQRFGPDLAMQKDFFARTIAEQLAGERHKELLQNLKNISSEYMEAIQTKFDSMDLWVAKFTTAKIAGEITERDSLYYQTKSGMTLRFKRVYLLDEGLSKVVQLPCEKIYFYDTNDASKNRYQDLYTPELLTELPVLGRNVLEFASDEFTGLVKGGEISSDISSQVGTEMKDGLIKIHHPSGRHAGHAVNKIDFIRNV